MCGFAGFVTRPSSVSHDRAVALLRPMADAILHRGPDSAGYWADVGNGIAMAHRRLAIVDLSEAGHQPMHSASGRFDIVFNGEIYNHLKIRAELETAGLAYQWRGHSDTETLLAGFDAWGVEETIRRCIGMFAIALWDRQARELLLVRDRLGEKPLYYGWQGSGQSRVFLFGSELKAFRAHPAFERRVNRNAIPLLLRHNYINAPHCIYEGIYKLEPGSIARVSISSEQVSITPYWSFVDAALDGKSRPFNGSPQDAVLQLESLLLDAIGQQMVADVPLGAFLSGGVDSSTVVALMQAQSSRPIKTFTIGFNETEFDESAHADAVARHLGTDHTLMTVSSRQALDVIPRLPSLYDEPFSDSSQIPTYLVSQLARQHVTVSLSGDAGDELFCGYQRYPLAKKLWGRLSSIPRPIRSMLGGVLTTISPSGWNQVRGALSLLAPFVRSWPNPGDKVHKGARLLLSESLPDLYRSMVSHWPDPSNIVLSSTEPDTVLTDSRIRDIDFGDLDLLMALDALTYLPGDILTKVDRAAMGVSLETRVPMLDHRVIEFACSLPINIKFRGGIGKWPLREVLYRHVPKELIERPKMGFGVPIKAWLRGPLREWAESLLNEERLRQEGFFNVAAVRQKWNEHQAGTRDWQGLLWDVLMFQAWLEEERRL